jgi:hypothetical protein
MWTVTRFEIPRRVYERDTRISSELFDLGDARHDIIAGFLKGTPNELEALAALGKGALPLQRKPMLDLISRVTSHARKELNALAGILEERGLPATEAELGRRRAILYALYDMWLRAKVAPNRIKVEQELQEITGLKTTSEVIGKLHRIIPRVDAAADEASGAYGVRDGIRPPPGVRANIGTLRDWLDMVLGADKPFYRPLLGLPQIGERRIEAGRQSAAGAFSSIAIGVTPRRRPGPLIVKVVNAAFGDANISEREIARARETFLEERAKEYPQTR